MSSNNPPGKLPRIAIVVAMTQARVIGSNNSLPWHIPEDLQLFKSLTLGYPILMGRKTFKAIGRPLPGRENLVLSTKELPHKGVHSCSHFMEALRVAARFNNKLFVIGGCELYRKAIPVASELHISWVKKPYDGNIFFPEFNPGDWVCIEEKDYPDFCYKKYLRNEVRRGNLFI